VGDECERDFFCVYETQTLVKKKKNNKKALGIKIRFPTSIRVVPKLSENERVLKN